MFWFKKKKDKTENAESENSNEKEELAEEITEAADDNEAELESEAADELEDDEEYDELDAEDDEFDEPEEIPELSVKLGSMDELAEFMNSRRAGGLQFMRIDGNEAFEVKESHIRLARVWGSVSMSRECTPEEYGRIMLALELIQAPEKFYVIPAPSESEMKENIAEFCDKKYGSDGKRLARSPEKFVKFLNENGDDDEWRAFSKEKMFDIACDFCEKNGISFDAEEENND